MLHDLALAALAAVAVGVCLLVHTKSLLQSLLAMLFTSLAIPLGYVLFSLLAGARPVPLINGVVVFFCLGIGVDHIFVFSDVWAMSRRAAAG